MADFASLKSSEWCGWPLWSLEMLVCIFAIKLEEHWSVIGLSALSRITRTNSQLYTVIGRLMRGSPTYMSDPRMVARELTGLCDSIFPRLVPSIVAHVNHEMSGSLGGCTPVSDELVEQSSLQRALLFEIGIVVAEMKRWDGKRVDWKVCVDRAVERQRRFYDRKTPEKVGPIDRMIAFKASPQFECDVNTLGGKEGGEDSS